MDDGVIIVDAITVDGRRVDPFTVDTYNYVLEAPKYDLLHTKSYGYNQIWSELQPHTLACAHRLSQADEGVHVRAPRTHRKSQRRHRQGHRVVGPRHESQMGHARVVRLQQKELFTFSNPDPEVQERYRENMGGKDPPELSLPAELPPPQAQTEEVLPLD